MFGAAIGQFDSAMFFEAGRFFSRILDLNKSDIPINVSIINNMEKKDIGGNCGPRFTKDSTHLNLKIELIEINIKQTTTVLGMIEALAHEMIHAKQFINGELTTSFERQWFLLVFPYFKTRTFFRGEDVTDLEYFERPYEREAFLFQKQLTYDFLQSIQQGLNPTSMGDLLLPMAESNKQ